MFKNGLTGHQLKIIGLIFMVCDHIHQMFYYAGNLSWLTMLGRIALPIFLFTCAEGYYHTRSKKAYAVRLTLWAMGMRVFSLFAIPFIALYNGQKGGGNKYFFYIFYPAHIYALYLLAYFLLKQGILS